MPKGLIFLVQNYCIYSSYYLDCLHCIPPSFSTLISCYPIHFSIKSEIIQKLKPKIHSCRLRWINLKQAHSFRHGWIDTWSAYYAYYKLKITSRRYLNSVSWPCCYYTTVTPIRCANRWYCSLAIFRCLHMNTATEITTMAALIPFVNANKDCIKYESNKQWQFQNTHLKFNEPGSFYTPHSRTCSERR